MKNKARVRALAGALLLLLLASPASAQFVSRRVLVGASAPSLPCNTVDVYQRSTSPFGTYVCWGGVWVQVATSGGGVTWGSIGGTLSAQADLQAALDAKAATTRALDTFGATTDITALNTSTTAHGLMVKLPGGTTNFFREDGTWQAIPGGGDMLKSENLSGLANYTTARSNMGLGTLATQSGTFSGTSSGTNTGDQTITLTTDVTGAGTGSFAATIANSAVTLAKQADMATASLVYRKTAGAGPPEVNTLATVKTDLALVKADVGLSNVDNTADASKSVSSAATLTTPRTINLASFNGSADIQSKFDDAAAPDDNIDLNASISAHGLMQKYPGGTTTFLRADGTFATPPGGGGSANVVEVSLDFGTALSPIQTVTVTGQAWVTASSKIVCQPQATTTDGQTIENYFVTPFAPTVSALVNATGFDLTVLNPTSAAGIFRFSCTGA